MKLKYFNHLLRNLGLSLALILTTAPAWSQLAPLSVISRIGEFPLEDYTPVGETHELKNRQIENQQQSEECYLFAMTNYLQVANANVFGHESSPRLSGPYLFTIKLLEYIDQTFQKRDPDLYLRGGNIQDAIVLISDHGLMPEKNWRPKIPFHQWPLPDLYNDVEMMIRHYQDELKSLKKEQGEETPAYQALIETAIRQTKDVVLKWSGPIPEKFEWEEGDSNPLQFAKTYGLTQAREFQLYSPGDLRIDESYLRARMKPALKTLGGRFSILQRSWDDIENQMRRALDQGVPVLVGLKWGRDGHVLTAIGYELRNGKVFAWKFLNSWGRWTPDGAVFYKASDVRRKADEIWIIR